MPVRAVFFDLDDTLLDTTGTQLARAWRIAERLQREGAGFDPAAFVESALALDPATGRARGVAPLIEELGLEGTDCAREAIDLWFFQGCLDLVRCLTGARAVVESLAAAYTLGIITNGQESRQRSKFEALGFGDSFQVFLTSERAGVEKPAQAIFDLALAEGGIAAADAVFVGDRLDVDIQGARDAGLRTVWLDHQGRVFSGAGPAPDARILAFSELPRALRSLGARV